jgi:hypothetical protein
MIGFIGLSDIVRDCALQITITHALVSTVTFLLPSQTAPSLSYQLLTAAAPLILLTHSLINQLTQQLTAPASNISAQTA